MATLMERLAFLQKVPTLMKATADDETPCPGYLFEEIGKISHESVGCCQCLLEYLLERLQAESCHVKLKVLKILHHLCSHGSQHFLTELRRNATLIQEATVFSGPLDPIHGNALHQRVRAAAQVLASQLFTDTVSPLPALSPCKAATPTLGMGSESGLSSGMQGFGYSPGKMTSNGGTLLDRIQKAAEVVASAVLPPTEQPGIRLHDNRYRAVVVPLAAVEVAVPACAYSLPSHGSKAQRCPGLAGGGWEDSDSSRSSRDSSQENGHISRASVGGRSTSKSGTDSQSGASRESGDLPERVEAMHLGDCGQEVTVVSALTEGSKAFLSREETQHFVKECAILNCEVVVELLTRKLQEPSHMIQMRALCAIACLMSSDLLTLDHIYTVTHKWLAQLSEGSPGPVTNKATKLLRQLDALIGSQTGLPKQDAATSSAARNRLDDTPKLAGALLLPTDVEETLSLGEESQTPEPECPTPADCPPGIRSVPSEGLARDKSRDAAVCDDRDRPPDKCSHSALQDSPGARPSLFSGMELVAGLKPVGDSRTGCLVFPDTLQDSGGGSPAHDPGQSRQQLSAFSFLNA